MSAIAARIIHGSSIAPACPSILRFLWCHRLCVYNVHMTWMRRVCRLALRWSVFRSSTATWNSHRDLSATSLSSAYLHRSAIYVVHSHLPNPYALLGTVHTTRDYISAPTRIMHIQTGCMQTDCRPLCRPIYVVLIGTMSMFYLARDRQTIRPLNFSS